MVQVTVPARWRRSRGPKTPGRPVMRVCQELCVSAWTSVLLADRGQAIVKALGLDELEHSHAHVECKHPLCIFVRRVGRTLLLSPVVAYIVDTQVTGAAARRASSVDFSDGGCKDKGNLTSLDLPATSFCNVHLISPRSLKPKQKGVFMLCACVCLCVSARR